MDTVQVTANRLTFTSVTIQGLEVYDNGPYFQFNPGDGGWSQDPTPQAQPDNPDTAGCKVPSGNPVLLATGNKVESETDFAGSGEMPLFLARTYNLNWHARGLFGAKWLSNFDYRLTFGATEPYDACFPRPGGGACGIGTNTLIRAWRPDGRVINYIGNIYEGVYYEDKAASVARIVRQANGDFVLYDESNRIETYSSAGYIVSVKNEQGVGWQFSYTNGTYLQRVTHTSGRYIEFYWNGTKLISVRDPAGSHFGYAYINDHFGDGYHQLAAVAQPGNPQTAIAYHYQNVSQLTGKSINGVRYSTFTYGDLGYPASTEHQGQDKFQFSFSFGDEAGEWIATETNPLGKQTTYEFKHGKLMTVTGHASALCPWAGKGNTYDANGYPDVVTDFKGNATNYDYNAKGQLVRMVEASNSVSPRITDYTWDAGRNRIVSVVVQGVSRTDYAYTTSHRLASLTATNLSAHGVQGQSRVIQYAYTTHANGMLATMVEDGPTAGSVDAITYTYSALGDLVSVANGAGHATTYSQHTGLGLPQRVVGANGEATEISYDAMGRTVNVRQWIAGIHTDTAYVYDGGLLDSVIRPDGRKTQYQYDAARRLVSEFEREGNGDYAVKTTTYNAMSLPVSTAVSRSFYPPTTRILGNIDGVYDAGGGNYVLTGWACSTGVDRSVDVHMYLGGPAGSSPHGYAYTASASSEPAVANACQSQGTAHRFSIPIGTTLRQSHGGKLIYIHGISPVGRDNTLIASSGVFSIPPLPPPAAAVDNAQFISQSVPEQMEPGQHYAVSVTYKNVGNTTWAIATGNYRLGTQNAQDNTFWTGSNRVALPHAVSPGEQVTFGFSVYAGETGPHNFQWRMVNDGVAWFGEQSPNKVVNIESFNPPPPPPPPCNPFCEVPMGTEQPALWPMPAEQLAYGVQTASTASTQSSSSAETVVYRSFVDYDELGRVVARRGNGGQNIRYTYDVNDNVRTITDSKGGVTTLGYDALDRLVYEIAPANQGTTWYEYDHGDRVTKVTDRRGLGTTYVYDGFGQLWSQNSPDTGTTSHTYNPQGQLASTTRNDGSWLHYAYDGLGRLTYIGNNVERRGYSYDWCSYGIGRLCGFETANTAQVLTLTHYGYNASGLLTVRRDLDNTIGSDDWTGYSYDGMGRLTGMSYPSGVSVGYGYTVGKLTVMQATFNGTTHNVATGMQYQPFGALTNMVYGSGQAKERQYDLDGRMTVTHDAGHVGHTLTYNPADEITAVQNWSRPEYNESFAYDALSRLSSITAPTGNQSFSYDPNGNRTQVVWPGTSNYTVDPWSNRISEDIAYAYDGRGNRSSQNWGGSTATFAYDAFNRLRTASRDAAVGYGSPGTRAFKNYPAGTTTYTVNAQDQRVAKSGSAGTTRFIYGGQTQLLTEGTTNVGWTSYIWMGGEPIAMVRNNQLYYFNNDHLGRPEVVTNQAQQLVWHAANFAFDRSVTYDAIGGLNLGFPGQYYDAETGFWHNGFRDYDSRTGRYVQSDPIGLKGGINTYTYTESNPISHADALGLDITVCSFTAENPWGHLGASINGRKSVGYYPSKASSGNPVTGIKGEVKFDNPAKKEECKTIATTPEQDTKMANRLGDLVSNPGTYTFSGNNCVAAVRSILEAAGLEAPSTIRPRAFIDSLETD